MNKHDEQNLKLVESTEAVDEVNTSFYTRFQYPWKPMAFDSSDDPQLEAMMLNQSIGDWDQTVVKPKARIWVAGCGTNQAVFTALRFPHATVIGSDLSETSLATASANANMLGIENLTLRQENLHSRSYENEFDYIICTGVIHHTADPSAALKALSRALKPEGVLELMVYNRYHRIMPTAFQKAIREWIGTTSNPDFDSELSLAREVVKVFQGGNEMETFLKRFKSCSESEFADVLLQPVEHFFTVESLDAIVEAAGLSLLSPCINQFDKMRNTFMWNLNFEDETLQNSYEALPNKKRWLITNHFMLEQSPMLWFYLNRSDASFKGKSDVQLCDEFLSQRFSEIQTMRKVYARNKQGEYHLRPVQHAYPHEHPDKTCRQIVAAAKEQPSNPMRDIFNKLELDQSFSTVNRLRLMLTTNAFPYLKASS